LSGKFPVYLILINLLTLYYNLERTVSIIIIIRNKSNPIFTPTKPIVSTNISPFNPTFIRFPHLYRGKKAKHGMKPLTRKLLIRSFWHGNCWSQAQYTMRVCLHVIVIGAASMKGWVAPPSLRYLLGVFIFGPVHLLTHYCMITCLSDRWSVADVFTGTLIKQPQINSKRPVHTDHDTDYAAATNRVGAFVTLGFVPTCNM